LLLAPHGDVDGLKVSAELLGVEQRVGGLVARELLPQALQARSPTAHREAETAKAHRG